MAFTSGTSTDFVDLLVDLKTWLTGTAGWTEKTYSPLSIHAKSVDSIANAGSDYLVGDGITLAGGTFDVATVLNVDAVDGGGGVTAASIIEAGDYSVAPGDPVAQGSTTGIGTGATFNMTYGDNKESEASLSLEGPGGGADKRVYINIATTASIIDGIYSWKLYGATGYQSGIAHGSQQGAGGPSFFNVWDDTIDYWFYANDRRFIVVAKVSTNYMSTYLGFFDPFALPSEYPFPLAIIGSYPEAAIAGINNARNSMIVDPGSGGAAWYRKRTTETWAEIENQANSGNPTQSDGGERVFMWPHKTGRTLGSGGSNINYWSEQGFNLMKLNFNDESPLWQAHIIDLDEGKMPVGALEGCYSLTGFDRSTEQTISFGGDTYRVFQRAFRNEPRDFWAVKEE